MQREITEKQRELLHIIIKGNPVVTLKNPSAMFIDIDQLIEKAADVYKREYTKQAIQFHVRALIKRGLIIKRGTEKRRGRKRVIYSPTSISLKLYSSYKTPKEEFGDA